MEISELGEFNFIDRITKPFETKVLKGVGDDAALIEIGDKIAVITKDMMLEGVDFDMTYTPLKHLGYKCVVKAISDVAAMNALPTNILTGIGISAKYSVENIEELYSGIKAACDEYGIELVGGDTNASLTGLTLSVTATGEVNKEKIAYRSGARPNDLICVTGDLGAAYLGTKLLEREKHVLAGNTVVEPKFGGFEYQLERALKPRCRIDLIKHLDTINVVPTSMIDISDGLASDLKQICKASDCSAKIFVDKLPITDSTYALAEELNSDATIAAMNGGDDYEMLFTVKLDDYDKILGTDGISIIGHITGKENKISLITPEGAEIEITAQGWK